MVLVCKGGVCRIELLVESLSYLFVAERFYLKMATCINIV